MKSYLFIFILIIPFFLNSQEINEAFFESLPEELKEDIEDRATQQSGYEDPIYRSIESQTELEKMELEQLKNRLEADLEYLRQKLQDDAGNNNKDQLNLFGSDFFSTYQSTYMPVNEPNLNPSYILDFGDVLEIQLIGQISETAIHQIKEMAQ